ncbi:UNVERIFIED_CONTAM: hypothetical protein FKN15_021528 [Acipenser sinensis]
MHCEGVFGARCVQSVQNTSTYVDGEGHKASYASSMARPSAALGAPEPLLHDLSQDPLLDILDAQASRSRSPSPRTRRAPAAPVGAPAPTLPQVPDPPSPGGDQGEQEEAHQPAQEATLSIPPSWDKASFSSVMEVPWTPSAEPRQSIFQTQAMAPRAQKYPAFPAFMEEVRSSWDRPASAPSELKQATQLASLEGVHKLGLAGFPPVDSTIAALVKAPPLSQRLGVSKPAMQGDGDSP